MEGEIGFEVFLLLQFLANINTLQFTQPMIHSLSSSCRDSRSDSRSRASIAHNPKGGIFRHFCHIVVSTLSRNCPMSKARIDMALCDIKFQTPEPVGSVSTDFHRNPEGLFMPRIPCSMQ